jgi:hypothetical protein
MGEWIARHYDICLLERSAWADTHRPKYPNFFNFILDTSWIHNYISTSYLLCIRIEYVSDTGYGTTWRIGLTSTSMTWWLAEMEASVSLTVGECA